MSDADPLYGAYDQFRAPTPEQLSSILPQFEVGEVIGQGGMGAVYKAQQKDLGRVVAIKVLAPPKEIDDSFNAGARFEREAQAMARMQHPNIVALYDYGQTEDGLRYMVMEYVEGGDLHRVIHGGGLTLDHFFGWIPQVCSALQYAHERSLVHRDIKPANILISKEGNVKLVDFGLAKLIGKKANEMAAVTIGRKRLGTEDYSPPETSDASVEEVDHRGDIYSLGVVSYEMLTRRLPRGAWKAPSALVPGLDPRFDSLLAKALQSDRENRYDSINDFQAVINDIRVNPRSKSVAATAPSTTKPETSSTKKPTKKKKKGNDAGLWIGIIIGLLLLIGAGIFFLLQASS